MKTRITLSQLEFSCLIGVFDPERVTPQTLIVDLTLELDGQKAALADRLEQTWDYDSLTKQIEFILKASHFYLLEAAAHVLARWALLPPTSDETRPRIDRVCVRLTKPAALPGEAQAVVEVEAEAKNQHYGSENKSWGTVNIVEETRRIGIYRLTILPGQSLPEHYHQRMREAELVLHSGLEGTQDHGPRRALSVGETFNWRKGQHHSYHNTGQSSASLLCMDSPPFDPTDEILSGETV
jgi:7,8-dihydroneopterin aldolase/epimerase/oxygenase